MNSHPELGVREMARQLDVSPALVVKMRTQGMPMASAAAASAWRAENIRLAVRSRPAKASPSASGKDTNYVAWRTRRERAEALKAENLLAEQARTLINAEAIVSILAKHFTSAKEIALSVPARLAPVFAAESDAAVIADLLDGELRRMLREIVDAGREIKSPRAQRTGDADGS